jgi:hypothetical protein
MIAQFFLKKSNSPGIFESAGPVDDMNSSDFRSEKPRPASSWYQLGCLKGYHPAIDGGSTTAET